MSGEREGFSIAEFARRMGELNLGAGKMADLLLPVNGIWFARMFGETDPAVPECVLGGGDWGWTNEEVDAIIR